MFREWKNGQTFGFDVPDSGFAAQLERKLRVSDITVDGLKCRTVWLDVSTEYFDNRPMPVALWVEHPGGHLEQIVTFDLQFTGQAGKSGLTAALKQLGFDTFDTLAQAEKLLGQARKLRMAEALRVALLDTPEQQALFLGMSDSDDSEEMLDEYWMLARELV